MSAPLRVSPRARKDLCNIARYTLKTWGRKQRDAYLREIDKRFRWLAKHPGLGKPRPDIKAGYHSFPQGSHVIFYLIREGGIDIIGVLHQRMDVLSHFDSADV
ncbi:plasmid stabilization protein [Thiohalocapsa halophila]|uniref:Toxin n=1 Tax=Thiohalocapsa halophila TaxID=69359 RepID=A0ABS1CF08_9GAMM|nr:type II toxin-antitoxin system RelE/ParE family toxin [Thiohalocapsa halophila]MBK1630497.1 plasmid stabilization protein [Thiohalocapsa halophila]